MRRMFEPGRPLPWAFDPLGALRRWPRDRRLVLLHSGRFEPRWARWSLLAEPVATFDFIQEHHRDGVSRYQGPRPSTTDLLWAHKPFGDLRRLLRTVPGPWVGYLGYELARWVERLEVRTPLDRAWPVLELAHCPGYLLFDGLTEAWSACGTWRDGGWPDLGDREPRTTRPQASSLRSVFSRPQYESSVQRVKDYIAAGDVFQVNLAQRFTAEFSGNDPGACRELYGRLAGVSPAWYGAYLELQDGRVVASTSPELFLECDRAGRVVTRPIKGTRPASVDAAELLHSEKDTAELNMIVDLLRNDLGRVCHYGSVRVSQARTIESHPTVHHGVATIEGQLHRSKDVVDLLRATMPGGSVTGAPKVRAMQIIDELEPVRRGPYCGCVGVLSEPFTCLSIAIRTMLLDSQRNLVDFSVGGGIVADSDPAAEYAETLDKAQAMLQALGVGPGTETSKMRWPSSLPAGLT